MSEANPNFDYEAQSLLVLTSNTSPRHILSQIIVLFHSVSKFRSKTETICYTSIDNTKAGNDEGRSESLVVVDDLSSTYDDSSRIDSVQDNSPSNIQLDSKVTSQDFRDDSHHGIELLEFSQTSVSTHTTSENASTIHSVRQDKLQRSQTKKITQIMKEKDLNSFYSFGGIHGVAKALDSDLDKGLCDEDVLRRKKKKDFHNQLPKVCFIPLLVDKCKSVTIFLLLVVAVQSVGFGLKEEGPETGWIDGAIIFVTIIMLVLFTSSCRYYYGIKLLKKSMKKVYVTRDNRQQDINISDVVHGDIVLLARGYTVPCDGFFIGGSSLEVYAGSQSIINEKNPFLFYGSRVISGSGRMIVASVGTETVWNELMRTNSGDKKSKVEAHLDKFVEGINIAGIMTTILVFTANFLWFWLKKKDDANGYWSEVKEEPTAIRVICNTIGKIITEPKGRARTLTSLLSVSLVGIMDGIPVVVSIAITLWNKRVLSDRATSHNSLACLKSSSVTCICTDKSGGLTEQEMEVSMVSIGGFVITESSRLSPKVLEALCEGIGTSVLRSSDACNAMVASLCFWATDAIGLRSNNMKKNWELLKWTEPDTCNNLCGVLMKKTEEDEMCIYWKGPVKEILDNCLNYYDKEGTVHSMNSQKRREIEDVNTDMSKKQLETVALACKSTSVRSLEGTGLNLIGLIGLKCLNKETTKVAIKSGLREGRVRTILVSADDVSLLKPIADEYGLLNPTSDLVLKGEDFQELGNTERMEKIDRIRVLGNCNPADKQYFVKCLKDRGEVVAMVGMRTDDSLALKESDIGVVMGIWNSEVAIENSDIAISNEGLCFFFNVIYCGRCFYGKLQKFIQLQLIMTASSLLVNLIAVILKGDAPMTAIQLSGMNVFMTIIDGMALLIWPLEGRQISQLTVTPTDPLIVMAMARNVVAQSIYQIITLSILQQKGHLIEGINQKSIQSMIFHSLIICQVFNLFNARELEKKNFFKGIHLDFWFWCALVIYSMLHSLYVAIEYKLAKDSSLNYRLWLGCFCIGIVSWLVDWIWKLVLPSSRIDCFTGWLINCAGKCKIFAFNKGWWLAKGPCLHSESLPPETNSNLHDPLINTSESLNTPHI